MAWTVFILVHRLNVFKGQQIFKKSWGDKKMDSFLNEKDEVETKFWSKIFEINYNKRIKQYNLIT